MLRGRKLKTCPKIARKIDLEIEPSHWYILFRLVSISYELKSEREDLIEERAAHDPTRSQIIFNDEFFSRDWVIKKLNQTSHLMDELGLSEGNFIVLYNTIMVHYLCLVYIWLDQRYLSEAYF